MIRARPRRELLQAVHLPAPSGGMNTADPAGALPPGDAIYITNMTSAPRGLRSRLGWQEHVTGLDSDVRTLMAFSAAAPANDKLFAATKNGIYDVTVSAASPALAVTFGTQNASSGYGVAASVVTAGGHFLLYCDEANGYYTYQEGVGWLKVTLGGGGNQITPTDPATFVSCVEWKGRVWFVERGTSKAWYLTTTYGIGTIYGTVAGFDFGQHFRYGGYLVGLYRWTVDGGNGADDFLVAIGSGGDVVVYKGTDPTSATTFSQLGVWFAGGLVAGRQIATDFGGDILILTAAGVLPLSSLTRGQLLVPDTYATKKIQNLFNAAVAERGTIRGWQLRLNSVENALFIYVPPAPGVAPYQLVMSFTSRGWSTYEGVDMRCAEMFQGVHYFGDSTGRVNKSQGSYDGVARDGSSALALPVDYSLLTDFSDHGTSKRKHVRYINPHLSAATVPLAIGAEARYDFDLRPVNLTVPALVASFAGFWDTGVWDSAVWGGGFSAFEAVIGAAGIGHHVAVAFRGKATDQVTYLGADYAWDTGGYL